MSAHLLVSICHFLNFLILFVLNPLMMVSGFSFDLDNIVTPVFSTRVPCRAVKDEGEMSGVRSSSCLHLSFSYFSVTFVLSSFSFLRGAFLSSSNFHL